MSVKGSPVLPGASSQRGSAHEDEMFSKIREITNMFTVYYDESGDDGLPGASPLFVLTAVYCKDVDWKSNFECWRAMRARVRDQFGLPITEEMHTPQFILGKKPYSRLRLSEEERLAVIEEFCKAIGSLDVRIVNVAIIKSRIRKQNYGVLDRALTYSLQRVENDLRRNGDNERFLVIVDKGRVAKMRATARRMQRFNYIPSIYGPRPYRREIELLIEDPLEKDSRESYFIQIADLVARIVYMYKGLVVGHPLHGRTPAAIDKLMLEKWLNMLEPSLNTQASRHDSFGIVCYPK